MKKVDLETVFALMLITLFIVLLGTGLFFSIYALVVYGDKPITEIPAWAFWLLKG